jgi:hypothetical protein
VREKERELRRKRNRRQQRLKTRRKAAMKGGAAPLGAESSKSKRLPEAAPQAEPSVGQPPSPAEVEASTNPTE